jgi:hypothetical protein
VVGGGRTTWSASALRGCAGECVEADGWDQAWDGLLEYFPRMAERADDHLRTLPGTAVPDRTSGRDDALSWLDAERLE